MEVYAEHMRLNYANFFKEIWRNHDQTVEKIIIFIIIVILTGSRKKSYWILIEYRIND